MANKVTGQVFGGDPKVFDDVGTVGELKKKMNVPSHTASVNGENASDTQALADFDFVTLAPAVKGMVRFQSFWIKSPTCL